MRAVLVFVLGLSLGAAGVLAFLASPGAPVVMAAADDHPVATPPTRPESESVPVLAVAPPTPPPAGAAVFAFDLADWARIAHHVAGKQENEPQHVWRILGRAYAREGRRDDLLRLAQAELAAKRNNAVGIAWLFVELPAGQRLSAWEALLHAHPNLETLIPKGTLGQIWLNVGARERGIALLVDVARAGKGQDVSAVVAAVAADPARADAELWPASGWLAPALWNMANVLSQHGRQDLAKRWQVAAVAAQGPGPTPSEVAAQQAASLREAEARVREPDSDAGDWQNLGDHRQNAGDPKGAFEAYARALEIGGLDVDLLNNLVNLDAAAALPIVERAAREDGADDFVQPYVRACFALGRGREAAEALFRMRDPEEQGIGEGVAALAPDAAIAYVERRLRRREGASGDALLAYADALLASGRSGRAFEQYRREVENGEGGDVYEGLVRADPGRAAAALEAMRPERAGDRSLDAALSDAYRRLGRKDDAVALAEAVAAADPGWPFLGLRALAAADPEKGLPRLVAACEKHEGDPEPWLKLGDVYRDLGRIADARAAYERALQQDSESRRTLVRLALLR